MKDYILRSGCRYLLRRIGKATEMLPARLLVAAAVATLLSAAAPVASYSCEHPDPRFAAFLKRFKSDPEFRYSRLVLPLKFAESEPGNAMSNVMVTHYMTMTLAQLRDTGRLKIVADPHASNTGDAETDVCEDRPTIQRNRATFVQYTCHSDVFSNTYHFVRRSGCWFLSHVEMSGA